MNDSLARWTRVIGDDNDLKFAIRETERPAMKSCPAGPTVGKRMWTVSCLMETIYYFQLPSKLYNGSPLACSPDAREESLQRWIVDRERGRMEEMCSEMKSVENEVRNWAKQRINAARGGGSETIILPHDCAPDELTSREIVLSSARLITLTRNAPTSLLRHLHSRFYPFGMALISPRCSLYANLRNSPPDDRCSHLSLSNDE